VVHRVERCRALHQDVVNGASVVDRVQMSADNIVEATGDAAGTRVDAAELRETYRTIINSTQGKYACS